MSELTIALAGNPNCGKTTLFNDLTGANQYTGNWPGVTVEKKGGKYKGDKSVEIADLPGVYSLSPYTPEEVVTRDYLMSGEADVVVNIVDATNLERNLYLTTQILNLGLPCVIALNMMDLIEKNGDKIDVDKLSSQLGCPIVEISALKGRGTKDVIETARKAASAGKSPAANLRFGETLEDAIAQTAELLKGKVEPRMMRWYAIKVLEGEQMTLDALNLDASTLKAADAIRAALEQDEDDDAESVVTNERYDVITDLVGGCVKKSPNAMTTTQKIDRVVTNRVLGIPIFVVIMFLVYFISVSTIGTLFTDWVNDGLFGDGWLYTGTEQYDAAVEEWEDVQEEIQAYAESRDIDEDQAAEALGYSEPDPADFGLWHAGIPVYLSEWLESINCAPWLMSLLLDGIVAGVGAVLGFIPQLVVLFILLGFLEGCGYMARVAFVMDRVFRRFGLSGKSFIPMLIASGCGVPAVMATKTIENVKDRRMTIMTTTMIPCGAKLPVIALVFGALAGGESDQTWWVAPVFYFLGLAAIIISCIILKKFKAFAGEVAPFIMELPQYHLPTIKNVLLSMWERVKAYVVKAGTIIFIAAIVTWFLLNFGIYEGQFGMLDTELDNYIQYSLMAMIGGALSVIFAPLGFASWEATATSICGLIAKENIVATVGIITSLGADASEADASLWQLFAAMFNGSSVAIMAFCAFNLLCAPCFAAMGAIRNQMANRKWFWAAIGYMCAFAWVVGTMIYQFGGLITGELTFGPLTVLAIILAIGFLYLLFRPMPKVKEAE